MSLIEWYREYLTRLEKLYDKREADTITDWVFENITGTKKAGRLSQPAQDIPPSIEKKLKPALDLLLQHTPVQYVLGEAWFYKMRFKVNEQVLIPRPETEELIEWVKESLGPGASPRVLDIGSGSGCIAIAIKKELPLADVTAIDVSPGALFIAKENASILEAAVHFLEMDFLDETNWSSLAVFEVIISNPPYIPEAEKDRLDKNVTAHEPHLALFVADDDPFIFYRKIAAFAMQHLCAHGNIWVEVHESYATEVAEIFIKAGLETTIRKDMYGRERMIRAAR